jgi:hypothetical protein
MSRFRTLLRFITAVLAALLLAACATGPRVTTDADPAADFSRYRSFAFYEPLALETRGYTTLLSARLKDEARRQMESRGYVYDEAAPDLRVNINAFVEEKTDVVTVPTTGYATYYSYRARAFVTVPVWHERSQLMQYTEGTVNVDLVDARAKQLVWEGVAVGSAAGRTPAERRERAVRSIATIFEAFPHRAGGAPATPAPATSP